MTHTITLDSKTEEAIARNAERLGMPTVEYVRKVLERDAAAAETPVNRKPKTGAELVDALEAAGVLTGYGDPSIDSPDLARQNRQRLSHRASA